MRALNNLRKKGTSLTLAESVWSYPYLYDETFKEQKMMQLKIHGKSCWRTRFQGRFQEAFRVLCLILFLLFLSWFFLIFRICLV